MLNNARRDQNRVATLLGVSSADETTPVPIYADPETNELFVTQGNSLPTSGNNPSTELGYNAAGQLIRIRETIGATTFVRNITGDSITDTTVATTKTFSSYNEE